MDRIYCHIRTSHLTGFTIFPLTDNNYHISGSSTRRGLKWLRMDSYWSNGSRSINVRYLWWPGGPQGPAGVTSTADRASHHLSSWMQHLCVRGEWFQMLSWVSALFKEGQYWLLSSLFSSFTLFYYLEVTVHILCTVYVCEIAKKKTYKCDDWWKFNDYLNTSDELLCKTCHQLAGRTSTTGEESGGSTLNSCRFDWDLIPFVPRVKMKYDFKNKWSWMEVGLASSDGWSSSDPSDAVRLRYHISLEAAVRGQSHPWETAT